MTTKNQTRKTYEETHAWYKKYEGELRRLEALGHHHGNDLSHRARAFADGVPYVPYRSPEERAEANAQAMQSNQQAKSDAALVKARQLIAGLGTENVAASLPPASQPEAKADASSWDDALPDRTQPQPDDAQGADAQDIDTHGWGSIVEKVNTNQR